jgi:predicted Zn-dependent peptidase
MKYTQITPFIHLVSSPMDRKQVDIEIVMSSGGSYYEQPKDRGRKHLMEHCIVTRTSKMNMKEFKDWQFRENIMMNAYTSPKVLAVTATTHSSQLNKAFEVCVETIFAPTFDQEVLDQEREIVLREISERSGDPDYITHFYTMKQIFDSKSVSCHQTLGSSTQVARTKLADFDRLHKQNLENSHLIITVTGGGIEQDFLTETIQKYLSKKEPTIKNILKEDTKLPINNKLPNTLLKFKYKPIVHKLAHEHSQLSILIPCDVNFENKPVQKLFEELFLRFYGQLYHILRDEKGFVYGISTSFSSTLQVLEIEMSCEIKYIKPILEVVREVFGDFGKYFSQTKFDELKKVICLKTEMASDSFGSYKYLTNSNFLTYAKYETYDQYSQRLEQVTAKDIQKMYNSIQKGLAKMQVVAVSKDKNVRKVEI